MALIDQFFGGQETNLPEAWIELESEGLLDEAIKSSKDKPVVLFKHSTRCGISASVKKHLEEKWNFEADELDFYFLDLLTYRSISNKIAADLAIPHESPQILLLKNGEVVYHDSHYRISVEALKKALYPMPGK